MADSDLSVHQNVNLLLMASYWQRDGIELDMMHRGSMFIFEALYMLITFTSVLKDFYHCLLWIPPESPRDNEIPC